MAIDCSYCFLPATLTGGAKIYPQRPDLYHLMFWECKPCGARVGCHFGTTKPLGRLASSELRVLKMKAHAAFDPIWQKGGNKSRTGAYAWLAHALGIPKREAHIGMFDEAMCKRVIQACNEYREGVK